MQNSSGQIPQHVAIIMDGNGRWAKAHGKDRVFGHSKGAEVVENITEYARELGVRYLTLYAFSKENWSRPQEEVHALMKLLFDFLYQKKSKLIENQIKLETIGLIDSLPKNVLERLVQTKEATQNQKGMTLTLALSYGSRDEIIRAMKACVDKMQAGEEFQITEENFGEFLDTKTMPDPDLVIRTSGEYRVSNFLLWQSAYAEFKFVDAFWPDFSREMFKNCLQDYQKRERRFGKTSEQL